MNNSSILQTQFGINWHVVKFGGKVGFIHNKCILVFSHRDNRYHLVHKGTSLLSCESVGDALDYASELILESYAAAIKPSWA